MNIFFSKPDFCECDKINVSDTVEDFIFEIETFCRNAYSMQICKNCTQVCCKSDDVWIDNVFYRKYKNSDIGTRFDRTTDDYVKLRTDGNACNFLQKNGQCSIYQTRPLICRIFLCNEGRETYFYGIMNAINYTYTDALHKEFLYKQKELDINKLSNNPALFAKNYETTILQCVDFAKNNIPQDDPRYDTFQSLKYK